MLSEVAQLKDVISQVTFVVVLSIEELKGSRTNLLPMIILLQKFYSQQKEADLDQLTRTLSTEKLAGSIVCYLRDFTGNYGMHEFHESGLRYNSSTSNIPSKMAPDP